GNHSFVLIMRTDPEPICCVALDFCERAVISVADPNRPNLADFLEVKRRQSGILNPKGDKFCARRDEPARVAGGSFPKIYGSLMTSSNGFTQPALISSFNSASR